MKKRQSIPWFTILIALLCIGMYFWQFYLRRAGHLDLEIYAKLGAPSTLKIFEGQYWGVIWNSFVHSAWQLLIFNLIAILYLGSYIERRTSFLTLLILGFMASTLTSLVQLGLTDNAGIGMTGASFFFLSYIYGRSFKDESFRMEFRNPIAIVGIFFLGVFVFTNFMNLTNFGIESMVAGLAFGLITGLLVGSRRKVASYSFVIISLIALGSTLFYSPWSPTWNLNRAYAAHNIDDYQTAKYYYNQVKESESQCSVAVYNLELIEIEELSDKAFKQHENEEYIKAHATYNKILELDPNHEWAKDQINKLP